ncbi:hypothetical protein ACFCX4_21370 [Kitasatospora sp. NPDC056327]|uniref:hypothetical protein n=1 Tax=Kitasatospora sp. NPDC056327 TaxID=3345785 RepID=UPI0035D62D8A
MTTESVAPSPAGAPPAAPPTGPPTAPAAALPGPVAVPPAAPAGPAAPAPPANAERAPRRPRRPRPVLLLVSGLVLGTAAGGGIGYAIQSGRPPTPLPPLQVALPTYPSDVLDPAAAAAFAPPPLAIDGDLRKLLISPPSGSKPWDDYPETPSWITAGELAEHDAKAAAVFVELAAEGFRRAVEVDWQQNDLSVRVTLTQFAADFATSADRHNRRKDDLEPFAPEANGGYQMESRPGYWSETTEQYYLGRAVAQRGTVVMRVEVYGTRPVNAEVVRNIAKQQWERLV